MKNSEVAKIYKSLAESFMALSEIYSSTNEETVATKEAAPKKEKPAKKAEPTPAEEPATETETKTYTKEDVRALLSEKAKADGCKYKAEVKNLVAQFSSDGTLTNVPEEKYAELMAALEVVGNA